MKIRTLDAGNTVPGSAMAVLTIPSAMLPAVPPDRLDDGPTATVVAKRGAIEDWAAYAGPKDACLLDIIGHGVKLCESEAVALFPFINIPYRR